MNNLKYLDKPREQWENILEVKSQVCQLLSKKSKIKCFFLTTLRKKHITVRQSFLHSKTKEGNIELAEAVEVDMVTLGSLEITHLNSNNNSSWILAERINQYMMSERTDNWIYLTAMENHLRVTFVVPYFILLAETVKTVLSCTETCKEQTRLM